MFERLRRWGELGGTLWGIVTSSFFKGTVWPIIASAVALMIGYFEGLSPFYLYIGTLFTFATVATGLLRFDEWVDRRRVEGKLGFIGIRVVKAHEGNGYGLGISLTSLADTPIEFEVVKVSTKIKNVVPHIDTYKKTKYTIPRRGVAWFDDHLIDFGETPKGKTLEGVAYFDIKYGRPGVLKYSLLVKQNVLLAFNEDGKFVASSWYDAL